MSLPQAIQKQVDDVDAFYAQNNTAVPDATVVPEGETAGTPAQPTSAPQHPEVEQKFEEKYRILQSKYNAEVPRLHARIRDLEQEVAQLKSQPQPAAVAPQASVPELVREIADAAGSPDLAQKIFSLIQAETSRAVTPVANQVSQVNQQVSQVQHSVQAAQRAGVDPNQQALAEALKAQGINFELVDTDPLFVDWLRETDPATGVERRQSFRYALHTLKDMKAVSEFYVRFVRDPRWSVAKPPAPSNNPPLQPTIPSSAQQPANPAPQVPVWNDASIKKFYDDWGQGRIPEEEAKRLEREIFAFLNAPQL